MACHVGCEKAKDKTGSRTWIRSLNSGNMNIRMIRACVQPGFSDAVGEERPRSTVCPDKGKSRTHIVYKWTTAGLGCDSWAAVRSWAQMLE
jgi:hypothetical protein